MKYHSIYLGLCYFRQKVYFERANEAEARENFSIYSNTLLKKNVPFYITRKK